MTKPDGTTHRECEHRNIATVWNDDEKCDDHKCLNCYQWVNAFQLHKNALDERDKWRKMCVELYEIVAQTCMCPMTAMTNQETCKYCVARKKADAMLGDKPEGEA